ncbi:YkgJ family cysteine cluster protein [Vibrio parahaemolyticus]|uniref:YkgJ family cysteine cluster protein n=1 Tax=Vibrio parahaemolyticus TaxID=670 RepID=UPI0004D7C32B|nr:YkgJ family cysteine cluster protein [Vibrio parahaemolyticus]EHK9005426.1 YkgJ family cysteine cluster protein [Vibrio vulnificus]AVW95426.1 YkgJ family cysteine cluster protein [Vibrio parahaemolyticus]EGQ8739653.1 YkgJ family cysteine cluster protein [Vibrio parahaemolyticus]EGQ8907685.1 YkgJ family cysteine cluster protein [Vibrio parahaemolyticus]EGR3102017.1 YkgJ family cysteine cluster protein [Vibrio parahaemolyticus]
MKDCNQCGKCCIKYGDGDLAATQEEIDLWELFNPDIFEYVKDGKIWFDPETREQLHRCPFLEMAPKTKAEEQDKYTCSIYLDRPEDCRHYPSLIDEMVRDECEMIEVVDLENPKKAQKQLDKLMSSSRPSSYS